MVLGMVLYVVLALVLVLIILADFLGLYGDENKHRDIALVISFSILGIVAILLSVFVV